MAQGFQISAKHLLHEIIPKIEDIIDTYTKNPENGLSVYRAFILTIQDPLEKMVQGLKHAASIGYISPRLLRDPLSTDLMKYGGSSEEIEAHIVGYLKAILQFVYCVAKGIEVWQFTKSTVYKTRLEPYTTKRIIELTPLIVTLKQEADAFEEASPSTNTDDRGSEELPLVANQNRIQKEDHDSESNDVPFTARLMAYYRALENKRASPLIIDSFAERLAGDLSEYLSQHNRYSESDYPVVRSAYIENSLLTPWCNIHPTSQIVFLGSGLDTRAYRFQAFKQGVHRVFEIDFPAVNRYKELVLQGEKPLCDLIRINADISKNTWVPKLINSGYSRNIPTFWILEGLAYYLEREIVFSLLKQTATYCSEGSQIFVDICVPILAEISVGPFSKYFKWGMNKNEVPSFFRSGGWTVSCSYADNHDQGRDVGQKGLIFVQGIRTPSLEAGI